MRAKTFPLAIPLESPSSMAFRRAANFSSSSCFVGGIALHPLTLAHQRLCRARSRDAIQVDLARADHPVHVEQAVIRALFCQRRRIHGVSATDTSAVCLAECNVTGGVLVKQGV